MSENEIMVRVIANLLENVALRMAELREETLDIDTRVFVESHISEVTKAARRARKLASNE